MRDATATGHRLSLTYSSERDMAASSTSLLLLELELCMNL
jgi:hypothetical protein